MNIVVCLAHSVEEFDQVRLLAGLGHDVFSIGAYSTPAAPEGSLRPGLVGVPDHPELRQACWEVRHAHRDDGTLVNGREIVDWAKYELPDAVFDWADVLIYHHFEHTWLVPQWERLRQKRVIWRTVGQSVEGNERQMAPLKAEGLQIVRYSPKERNIPGYAGEDALIRFYKDPGDYGPWIGDIPAVVNVTQDLYRRSLGDDGTPQQVGKQFTNWSFWNEATKGLPTVPIGPGSEQIGGTGGVSFDKMREFLNRGQAYLFTGTQPASYTLGLIEAMMSGIPTVSIGPGWMQVFPYGPMLFEGHEIAPEWAPSPPEARALLRRHLTNPSQEASDATRARAIDLFGIDKIGAEWKAFLG